MFKTKIKLIALLYFVFQYFVGIRQVVCRPINHYGSIENGNFAFQDKVGRDEEIKESRWPIDREPYINVIKDQSREWTNLHHSQPLKRSDEATGMRNLPLPNDLGCLNMTNPISKYCNGPINLLYNNNVTVQNYFMLVPGNGSCNDTIRKFEAVSEEPLEMKALPSPRVLQANQEMKTVEVRTISVEPTSSEETTSESPKTTPNVTEATTVSTEMNTTVPEVTATTESNVTIPNEVTTTTMEVMVEILTLNSTIMNDTTEATTVSTENTSMTTPKLFTQTLSEELMRTLDKYCETFNLSNANSYTINPVTIGLNLNSLVEEKGKLKRTPHEENCRNFNMSSDLNYTIQPVPIPQRIVRLANKSKANVKKQQRNLSKSNYNDKSF
ncbi:uncharacterized protein LOC128997123 [Macrosteles quadrilineatus]|uniref:uncharacterized protein LOC128997123 n=1 Tax=Macrosteles quadrilineatus TaxID=74068 RepID=UPI0023E27D19|nr:uncharacterized protein LOC128997123 [Macrosteles quadrilineatus]